MPIRVLHIIGNLRLGGAQVIVKQIAENFDPREVESFIYPLRSKEIQTPVRAGLLAPDYPNYDPRKFFAIERLCREHKIDLIHAHLYKSILGSLLSPARRSVPVIIHEHGPVCRSGLQYGLYRRMLKRLWPRAAAVIAVSNFMAAYLVEQIGIAKEKIHVLPNAIDFAPFDQRHQDILSARKELGIPEDAVVLGYVGRLSRVKGADLLPEILRRLLKEFPNTVLLIAGDGEAKADIRRQCRRWNLHDHVRLLGFMPDVRPVMAASDAALVPSRQEAFGISALEWMRMRVPLITSGADGLGELIAHKQTGWIVEENTPAAYTRAAAELLQNRPAVQPVVERAYEQTKAYEIAPYLRRLHGLYQQVLRQPR